MKIEETGAMAIKQHYAEAGECSQQLGQRLEIKMAAYEKLRAAGLGGKIVLAPEVLGGAGEDGFAVRAIAPQILRQAHDAVNIGAGRLAFFSIILILALQLAKRLAGQVLR
jgi:hypothetical protein